MKRVLIASLVVALSLTACATETADEDITPTIEPTTEAVETVVVTEPVIEVTEPVAEIKPVVEIPPVEIKPVVEATPVVEIKPVEPTEEVKVEEVTEPVEVEVIEPTEAVEPDNTYLGNFKLTAYCACARCCGKSDGITATGTVATQGRTIAVDPRVIPYGTAVSINGNTYIAEDCGGAIGGNRIDVFFDSHTDALNFGVQYADVYLVGVD